MSHLWRRGLTFDASLAVSVFDETLTAGRPADIVTFRRALIAGRLDLRAALLPDDPVELAAALRALGRRTREEKPLRDEPGSFRLATTAIKAPKDAPGNQDFNVWDPDGTRPALGLDVLAWLTLLTLLRPGRSLRIASTTVIVDDAYVLTGSTPPAVRREPVSRCIGSPPPDR